MHWSDASGAPNVHKIGFARVRDLQTSRFAKCMFLWKKKASKSIFGVSTLNNVVELAKGLGVNMMWYVCLSVLYWCSILTLNDRVFVLADCIIPSIWYTLTAAVS